MVMSVDVSANRRAQKWNKSEQLGRILWACFYPLFRFSPRPFWFWRTALLRFFGARIGKDVHIYPTVIISIPWNIELGDQSAVGDRVILYALGQITIKARTTVSQGSHLCAGTHDYTQHDRPLLKPPIIIEEDVWVAADAFIGPGVTVGKGAIVGARSVVIKNVDAKSIVGGNPARTIKKIVVE
jgi:putative colanic acid biosynthesis acetyltransferase WcaF